MAAARVPHKTAWFLAMIAYFVVGYLLINWLTLGGARFVDVSIAVDRAIPFAAPFILGYLLVYGSILIVFLAIDDASDWRRTVIGFFLATTVAYAFFLLLPVRMKLRPELAGVPGWAAVLTRAYYAIDLPHNCFPSLHVTYPTLAALLVWRHHSRLRWVLATMALVVAISVVLVKQHYIADVVAGFVNAGLCFWVTTKIVK